MKRPLHISLRYASVQGVIGRGGLVLALLACRKPSPPPPPIVCTQSEAQEGATAAGACYRTDSLLAELRRLHREREGAYAAVTVMNDEAARNARNSGVYTNESFILARDLGATVDVFFATDRNIEARSPLSYGDQRAGLSYGFARVSIPPTHRPGQLESPSLLHLEFRVDSAKHIVLDPLAPLDSRVFFKRLHVATAATADEELFVFIHGFNTPFEEALRRTAQIAFDLGLKAVPVLYSWPSKQHWWNYVSDEQAAEYTVPHLQDFLQSLAQQSGAKKIHVLAHSMGSRALLRAIVSSTRPAQHPEINTLILAAPDIDADVFRTQIAPALGYAAKRTTLYVSSGDEAVSISAKLHGALRAGAFDSTESTYPGIETVDASKVDSDWLGHSYVVDDKEVLDDVYNATILDMPAPKRNLKQMTVAGHTYWVLP